MTLRRRLALAIACGIAAAAFMGAYACSVRGHTVDQRAEALARYGGETARVLVATRDIVAGETFSERNVAVADWLVDLLPEGALTDAESVMGRVSALPVARNAVLSKLCVDQATEALEVPPGTVAVSVPCSVETAVGGAIRPNSIVDLFIVSAGSARLLGHGVQVLQVGPGIASSSRSWATIAVEADKVEAVVAASSAERLFFVLPSAETLAELAEAAAAQEGREPDGSVPAVDGQQVAEQVEGS